MDGTRTMNKTNVLLTRSLLDYRQEMAQLVHEARDERLRIAANFDESLPPCPRRLDIHASDQAGLLFPPRIEMLWPDLFRRGDQMDGLIQINTSDVFGIVDIHVTLWDEAGTLLESGY